MPETKSESGQNQICLIALGEGQSGEPWDPPECLCPDCSEEAAEMDERDAEMRGED